MRNFLRAALVLGTLSAPMVVMADTPAKDAKADKTADKAPAKTDTKAPAKTDKPADAPATK